MLIPVVMLSNYNKATRTHVQLIEDDRRTASIRAFRSIVTPNFSVIAIVVIVLSSPSILM